jgi:hypothetical protein
MKHLLIFVLVIITGCSRDSDVNLPKQMDYSQTDNSFNSVWKEVASDPLDKLPHNTVSFGKLFTLSKNIILDDAKRTLVNQQDILKPFDKLAHPNGICLKGTWEIYKENPYSGYFKKGSKALIIARASTALSNTSSDGLRAFGFAGKLFASTNPSKATKRANFFAIDDLGGTNAKHYTDVAMTNEPSVTTTSAVAKNLLYALKVARAFSLADTNSGIRQLYEISELGESSKSKIKTPKWIKIEAKSGQTVDKKDFRDELKITNKNLVFNISVASTQKESKKDWLDIGTISFNQSVVSNSCDHRLHFHHPKWRDDLTY